MELPLRTWDLTTKVHHGWLPTMTYGSMIHIYSSRRWFPILNSKVNLTSHLIKNTAWMISTDFRTSCQRTGHGNKQWVSLRSKGASHTVNQQDKIIINHPESKGAFFILLFWGVTRPWYLLLPVKPTIGQYTFQLVTYITICNMHIGMVSYFSAF